MLIDLKRLVVTPLSVISLVGGVFVVTTSEAKAFTEIEAEYLNRVAMGLSGVEENFAVEMLINDPTLQQFTLQMGAQMCETMSQGYTMDDIAQDLAQRGSSTSEIYFALATASAAALTLCPENSGMRR